MILFLFYVHLCFACMYVCVGVSDPMQLELQTVVSCRVWCWDSNPGPVGEPPVVLTAETSHQIPPHLLQVLNESHRQVFLAPNCFLL